MVNWGGNIRIPSGFPRSNITWNTPTRITKRRRFLLFFTKTTVIETTWENISLADPTLDYVQFPAGDPAYGEISKWLQR